MPLWTNDDLLFSARYVLAKAGVELTWVTISGRDLVEAFKTRHGTGDWNMWPAELGAADLAFVVAMELGLRHG
jgi:hypothetical protein